MARPLRIFIGLAIILGIYFLPIFDSPIGKLTLDQMTKISEFAGFLSGNGAGLENYSYMLYAAWLIGLYLLLTGLTMPTAPNQWETSPPPPPNL